MKFYYHSLWLKTIQRYLNQREEKKTHYTNEKYTVKRKIHTYINDKLGDTIEPKDGKVFLTDRTTLESYDKNTKVKVSFDSLDDAKQFLSNI